MLHLDQRVGKETLLSNVAITNYSSSAKFNN